MTHPIIVRFIREDSGNFRHYYRGLTTGSLYCTAPVSMMTLPQWEKAGNPLEWLHCSKDGEPEYVVDAKFHIMEIPK